ncbi:MAG: response regulator transcription factor [Chloroflexi bacterium]|nr:response regulator transcription factor [Chloroflexota bacterium]
MNDARPGGSILIVDDEAASPLVSAVRRGLEKEGWRTVVVEPEEGWRSGEEFEAAALYAIEESRPDGVLLDVRFGDHRDDLFKGLDILRKIVTEHPKLPVLMFTQYTQGPDRETAVRSTLRWDAPVDFIDKLASPEEVVLRLRRLIGTAPEAIRVGARIVLNVSTETVEVAGTLVTEISGMRFEILRELAVAWYRSPGQLVPFATLERYSEGEDARASLRVRVREIKDALGKALGEHLGAGDLIINVRDQGYRLVPPG